MGIHYSCICSLSESFLFTIPWINIISTLFLLKRRNIFNTFLQRLTFTCTAMRHLSIDRREILHTYFSSHYYFFKLSSPNNSQMNWSFNICLHGPIFQTLLPYQSLRGYAFETVTWKVLASNPIILIGLDFRSVPWFSLGNFAQIRVITPQKDTH